jgi:hypothetical protein
VAISPDIESGPFIGNGAQTAFPFSFTAITPAEVAVELDDVSQSAGFTVTLADVGGTVTFAMAPAAGARITLRSRPDYLQDSAFENEGAYNLATVNTINRRQTVRALVTRDQAERAVKAPGGDGTDMTLPIAAARADKLLGFGAIGDGAPPAVFDISANALETLAGANGDIVLLADNIGSIDSVAANLSGSNTIGTVATNIANVDAVGGAIAAVGAVAGDLTPINAVAGNATNINAVAGNATNINAVASNATNVSAVATISGNVTQVANDHAALVAVANDLANLDAVATNLPAVNAVVAAAVTLGVFPNSANVGGNIPKGAISFSFTGGSGGTNSVNNVATFTGGTLTYNPQILYDVVGGAVTNVRMLFGGLYIGSSTPAMPTVVLANGGSGTVTLAQGRYYVAGQGYWASSVDGRTLDRIVNVSNTPALDVTVPSITAASVIGDLQNAAGRRNLWPDPFHLDLNMAASMGFRSGLAGASTPFTFGGGVPSWIYSSATSQSPYPDGKVLTRPGTNVATPEINLFMARLGLVPGDIIEFSQEMAYAGSGSLSAGTVAQYAFYDGAGTIIGSAASLFTLSAGAGALTTTPKRFTSGAITVPAGATSMRLTYSLWGGSPIEIYSTWLHKGATLPKPIDRLLPPDLIDRFRAIEASDPTANNILLKQYVATATTLVVGGSGLNTFAANNGMGSNFVTAGIPAGGFNAIQQIFNWASATNGPARIYAQIRTAAVGGNACNGRLVAEGWIGTDPNSLTSGLQSILLYDVVTGLPRTIQAADVDLLGRYSVIYFGVKADGSYASQMYVNYGAVPDGDPTFPGFYIINSPVGLGAASLLDAAPAHAWAGNRVLLTTPTVFYSPAPTFSGNVAASLDQVPALEMLPQRIWNVVGMETWCYFAGMQHRSVSRTNFYASFTYAGTYPTNPSGQFEEGVCIKEVSAGTKTLTISASIGATLYSTKSTSVKTAANTAGAGMTARVLGLGSSLMQNAGLQSNLLALVADTTINPGGAATGLNIVNVGTIGSAPNKNEGRSGQSIGIYFSPGDVFYNPGTSTFDFAYYVANSLAGVPPTHVVLGDPFWSVASAASDGAAAIGAAGCVALIEQMITSIAAYNTANTTTIKTIVWFPPVQPEFGQDGEPRSLTSISQHQRNRNLKEVAKLYAATFTTAREAALVYAAGFNVVGNSEVTNRYSWAPRGPGTRASISTTHGPYADYATMIAAANVINDGEILQVGTPTPVSYWVKQGTGVSGGFRSVCEIDGFARRIIDSTHGCPYREIAQQVFACIKNNP